MTVVRTQRRLVAPARRRPLQCPGVQRQAGTGLQEFLEDAVGDDEVAKVVGVHAVEVYEPRQESRRRSASGSGGALSQRHQNLEFF